MPAKIYSKLFFSLGCYNFKTNKIKWDTVCEFISCWTIWYHPHCNTRILLAQEVKCYEKAIVYKKTDEWYIERQRVTNEWHRVVQRMVTSDNEWQPVAQRMTTGDNEWQRMIMSDKSSDNEWQRKTTSDNQPVTKSDKNFNEWQRMTGSGTTTKNEREQIN